MIFHPSRQDWGKKNNHHLFHAVAQVLRGGIRLKLLAVDWGVDVSRSRALIKELGIQEAVEFVAPMPKSRLIDQYRQVDVVVDQFFLGAPGKVFFEAMACGAPVVTYIREEYLGQLYKEPPPFWNAKTVEDIVAALRQALEPENRLRMGEASRQWIERYHGWEMFVEQVVSIYEDLLEPCGGLGTSLREAGASKREVA